MVIATAETGSVNRVVQRHSDASAADTAKTLTTPTGRAQRLIMAFVKYSASPTQAGVTVGIDSGVGAAYDATLSTGSANAQTTVYIPANDMIIDATDAFVVTAPAAGGAVTSQISIYTEPLL